MQKSGIPQKISNALQNSDIRTYIATAIILIILLILTQRQYITGYTGIMTAGIVIFLIAANHFQANNQKEMLDPDQLIEHAIQQKTKIMKKNHIGGEIIMQDTAITTKRIDQQPDTFIIYYWFQTEKGQKTRRKMHVNPYTGKLLQDWPADTGIPEEEPDNTQKIIIPVSGEKIIEYEAAE